jgi:hypothetical protein
MVLLWLSREETKPDPRSIGQYPSEMMKKRDPASPWPIFRSFSTVGIRGARAILERKFNRKIPARKRRGAL